MAMPYHMAWEKPLVFGVAALLLLCFVIDFIAEQRWQNFFHNINRVRTLRRQRLERRQQRSSRRSTLRDVNAQGDRLPDFIVQRLMNTQNPHPTVDPAPTDSRASTRNLTRQRPVSVPAASGGNTLPHSRQAVPETDGDTLSHGRQAARQTPSVPPTSGLRNTAAYLKKRPNPLKNAPLPPLPAGTNTYRLTADGSGGLPPVTAKKRRLMPWVARRTMDARRFLKRLPRRGWRYLRRKARNLKRKWKREKNA